jgi:hypothetical protein
MLRPGGGNVNDKKTMTLNLTAAEMEALDELARRKDLTKTALIRQALLARRKDLTKTALIRQALRLYQAVDARVSQGEKLFFEDEVQKKKAELMVLG